MSKLAKALTAAAGNAGGDPLYAEDVFSTYLYEGNNAARTIANGIALSDEGGLVWLKQRGALDSHVLFDTVNGPQKSLASNDTAASANYSSYLSFPSAGTAGWNLAGAVLNGTGTSWASWTFRKAKKFFDVVTYSSDTTSGARTISHNLGSTPAFIIVKGLNFSDSWYVYHIGTGVNKYLELNLTGAGHASTNFWGVTDSTFTVDSFLNNNGLTGKDYVAYLFASDAGGFGDDGDESIIKCGSFTGNTTVDLGFEPAWIMIKPTSTTGDWDMHDVMRGWPSSGDAKRLKANLSAAEDATSQIYPNATGFSTLIGSASYIYIAIRRPMKTPESGTEVFGTVAGAVGDPNFLTSFPVDMGLWRTTAGDSWKLSSRLTGVGELNTNATTAEITNNFAEFDYMNGWYSGNEYSPYMSWMFKRATGFFDVVAYTGNATVRTVSHNLGVVPELMIVKKRNAVKNWYVYSAADSTKYLYLNGTNAFVSGSAEQIFGNDSTTVAPTSSVFSLGSQAAVNGSGDTFINYLFATLAGVSKVGSYTGTGSNVDVDCGFSAGARFILIKRTDSTGDWYLWDSLRGIVAGNDPYLLLNTTAAEVTSTDYIDPLASGFTVTSSASSTVNVSSGSYIFLAIA